MQQMKQPSPLVPQGTFEAQGQRKSHVRIAVFTILAIHVVVLGGLLILGCKREDKSADANANPPTNGLAVVQPFTNTDVVATTPPPAANATPTGVGLAPVPATPTPATPVPPANNIAEGVVTEHTIVKGDNFGTLATKYGVSVKDIQAANPNLQPTRLQIGDKVKIPPKSAAVVRNGTPAAAVAYSDTYTVKSGDVLSKIAKDHSTTVKEIQRLNNLTTTQIKVGQKLKLPPRSAGSGTAVPPGTTPPPAQ